MSTPEFSVANNPYPINIDYLMAYKTLPDKFNIDLLELFTDEQKLLDSVQAVALDDMKTLGLMFFFMQESGSPIEWEDFLSGVKTAEINNFRESFWRAAEVFFGPPKDQILRQIWKEFQKELKTVDFSALKLSSSLSGSNLEESISTAFPSEKSSS